MSRKLNFSLLILVFLLALSLSSVVAEEADEGRIIVAGIELGVYLSAAAIVVFGVAAVMCYRLVKKLYGGKFTSVLPYLLMAVVLLLGMQVLHLMGEFLGIYLAESSHLYQQGIQVLQLLAGFFFISALYHLYQVRFATEGFIGGGVK